MMLQQRLRQEAAARGGFAFKVVSFYTIAIATASAQIVALWLSTKGSLFPGTEALMSIITTCSQIIAGMYGVTLAGYTFFLSRIDALMSTDATLDYVVASIKTRFQYLIWYITFNVAMTLFVSIVLMYLPAPADDSYSFFYRLFCNEFVLFVAFSIVLILYYSILVVDPNCIEEEAAKLKRKLSRGLSAPGSVTEFIALYDKIENRCNSLLPQSVLHQLRENKGRRFECTIALLQETYPALCALIGDLNRVHRYYECVVNCSPMCVTREMCVLARKLLTYLDQFAEKALP